MSTKPKSEKPKSEKVKSAKPKAAKVESKKSTDNSQQSTVVSGPLTSKDLRLALKGKNATERNQLRRANALAVKNARKAKLAAA